MTKQLLLAAALLALPFTAHAQTTPPATVTATPAQIGAAITASGITLDAGQTTATIESVNIGVAMMSPLSTPIQVSITYAPDANGKVVTDHQSIDSTHFAAAVAALPALPVSTPRSITARLVGGSFTIYAR